MCVNQEQTPKKVEHHTISTTMDAVIVSQWDGIRLTMFLGLYAVLVAIVALLVGPLRWVRRVSAAILALVILAVCLLYLGQHVMKLMGWFVERGQRPPFWWGRQRKRR